MGGGGVVGEEGISYNGVYVKFVENLIDVIKAIQMMAINKYRILINARIRTCMHVYTYLSTYLYIRMYNTIEYF